MATKLGTSLDRVVKPIRLRTSLDRVVRALGWLVPVQLGQAKNISILIEDFQNHL